MIENRISKRYWHTQVCCCLIHSSQELQSSYAGPLPPRKGRSLFLLELLLRLQIYLSCPQYFGQNSHPCTYRVPYPPPRYSTHSISSDQQLFSLQMKRDSLLILIEFLGLSMFPIIWGGSWLDRIMEWLPHNVSKEKESWKAKDPRVPLRTTTSYDVSMSFPFAVPFGGWKRLGFRLTDG